MNQYPGVKDSMIMVNNECFPYVWIVTDAENRTTDFKEQFKAYIMEKTDDIVEIQGFIFIDRFPRTSNGKVSRALMKSILFRQECQIPVSDQEYLLEVKRTCYDQVGDVN